ncbi:MAG: cytochrome c [bacterium]|nr:cytochrome c [bacterium]
MNQFLIQPTHEYLPLISALIYLMLLFHLPYLGMVLGSSILSTAYNKWKPDLSKDFINLALGKPGFWLAFGLLPAVSLAFLYKMQLFNTPIPIHLYFLRLSALLVIGFVLLTLYRRTSHLIIGAAGTLALLLYGFHFINVTALLVYPEKWFFLKAPLPFPLFSITPLIHFAAFLFLTVIMTGAAILFFYYRWPEKRLPEDSPHHGLMKYHGYGLLLVGSLLLPVILFWDLYNLPGYSLSVTVFVLAVLVVITLFLLTVAAAIMIRDHKTPRPRFGVVSFLLALLLFGLVIGKDLTVQANASRETAAVLKMDALKARNAIIAKREEIYAKNMVIDPALGEKIYTEQCTACHTFDKKKLGPPLNDVLPRYKGNEKKLIAFITNPTKVDPNYTSMPNPGLTPIQVKAVVKFLVQKMGMETPDEKKEEAKSSE